MNVDDLISRATHTSGRTLMVVSSIVLFANHYELDLIDFPIIQTASDTVKPHMVEFAAQGMVLYLIVAHLLNWFTDKTGFDQGALMEIFKTQKDFAESPNVVATLPDGAEVHIEPYEQLLLEFRNKTHVAYFTQKVSLFGQHLFLPVAVGGYALSTLWW